MFEFEGDEQAAAAQNELASRHEDWSDFQQMSDVVLTPAACYPLYPAIAARGPLPVSGVTLDTGDAYVFRREPSNDPARMQIFHMREIVRIGDRGTVVEWRAEVARTGGKLLGSLGLTVDVEIATDPFFGRVGRLLAAQQREQDLKWELLAATAGPQRKTAVASSNYHQDHMGQTYGLRTASGETAHTGCMAFGEERVVLALLNVHGLDPRDRPSDVRGKLAL